MGVSIYPDPDPSNNHTNTHVYGAKGQKERKGEDTCLTTAPTVTTEDKRIKGGSNFRDEVETQRRNLSCSGILTVTLLSSSPSVEHNSGT